MEWIFRHLFRVVLFAFFTIGEVQGDHEYIIPCGRAIFSPIGSSDKLAFSFLIECGPKNGRLGATMAMQLTGCSRLKVSGEYLGQKSAAWMNQGAFGVDYQHLIPSPWLRALDLNLYTAYAPSKKRASTTKRGVRIDQRIAGSNTWGGSFGTTWALGEFDLLQVGLDFDHVQYRRKFSKEKVVSGLGANISLTHRLQGIVDITFEGEFRRPLNYIGMKASPNRGWADPRLSCALFGGYTQGKMGLYSSSILGIELTYLLTGEIVGERASPPVRNFCNLISWAGSPAVYMPEVLAISEERRIFPCMGPNSRPIPLLESLIAFNPFFFSVSPYFTSTSGPIAYSISGVVNAVVSVDTTSGQLQIIPTLNPPDPATFSFIVTGANSCGASSQLVQGTVVPP